MEKRASGAARAIDGFFIEQEIIVGIVVILFANHVDQAGPAVADANDLKAFTQGAQRDRADGRIEAGDVPSSSEDRKSTRLNSSHVAISYAVFCLKKKKYIVRPTKRV